MRTSLSKGAILLSALVLITSLAGCSKEQPAAPEPAAAPKTSAAVTAEPGSYADGFYFAQEDGFSSSGWKYTVAIEVKDGKIISAE
jgi:major membrane immunogen (membrane-anchored lipoprotein)